MSERSKNLLSNFDQIVKDAVEKAILNLFSIVQASVSNSIIGESYYKGAGTNTILPTIVFKEPNAGTCARKSQTKVRINTQSEDLTEDRNRPIMSKRVTALSVVEPLTVGHASAFSVVLYKVSLLVCSLKAPLSIYNAPN